jgi:aspartate kinase
MGKCTNLLEKILDLRVNEQAYKPVLEEFQQYHLNICEQLFPSLQHPVIDRLWHLFSELTQQLEKNFGNYDKTYDQIVCFGELVSSQIVHAYLHEAGSGCELFDARQLIITDSNFREGRVRWDLTQKAISNRFNIGNEGHYLTQGFIAGDEMGNSVTLGREGSDFSAAILAFCLMAESVTIWKDVPGVLNADPDYWKDTVKYDVISYGEAAEMTYYGASVIHPKTIRPLAVKKIPLLVKSFLQPDASGTRISEVQHDTLEPAIIFKKNQCLISFQVRDYSFINESKVSMIFHLFEEFNIKVNMMQSSAISFSVSVDSPDDKLKMLINSLSGEFEIFYNDHLELITVKNYLPDLLIDIVKNKEILLEQKTRKNYQVLVASEVQSQGIGL